MTDPYLEIPAGSMWEGNPDRWAALAPEARKRYHESHEAIAAKTPKPAIGHGSNRKRRDDEGRSLGRSNFSTQQGRDWLTREGWHILAGEHSTRHFNRATGKWQSRL